jgi:hypothetical protein
MKFTTNVISKRYNADAKNSNQPFKALAAKKGTPKAVCNTFKINPNLTRQLLYVSKGTIGVLSYAKSNPADKANTLHLIGRYGNEIDSLAPVVIPVNLCLGPQGNGKQVQLARPCHRPFGTQYAISIQGQSRT